jgi:sensor histidine kinase YesM
MQNPFLTDRKTFLTYAGIWLIVTCFHVVLLTYTVNIAFLYAFTDSVITNIIFAVIGLGLWYPIFYGKTENSKLIGSVVNHVFSCIVALGIWIGIQYFLLASIFESQQDYLSFLRNSIPWRMGIGVLYYGILILVYYIVIYYRSFKENLIKEAELRALVKESELSSLKSQINPHFLFNSLNSISSLTMIQPAKAQEMIIKLSEFLRYSISNKDEKLTTLSEEMENINRYLDIEKIRFGKRLIIKQSVEESCWKFKLPGLILQPLIENAVKYGVYESIAESYIDISCTCIPSSLIIMLKNEYDPDYHYKKGEGIGIQNIRNRLRILYNRDDLLILRKDEKTFEVKIIFPQFQ